MNWISLKLKKLSTKLYIVYILMFVTLASVVITSYVAVDTQRQHLILTDMLGAQSLLSERVGYQLTIVGQIGMTMNDTANQSVMQQRESITENYNAVQEMLEGFVRRRFEYTEGKVVELHFQEDFERVFDQALQQSISSWSQVRYYINYLTDPENLADHESYTRNMEAFQVVNDEVLENIRYVSQICREEADRRMEISKLFQYGSIALSIVVLGVLIYLITDNFYNPIMEIRRMFKRMSKGDISPRFMRDRDDEFKELYDNFNFFLNNLESIFRLEDKIILENRLDVILTYLFTSFRQFIPFTSIVVEYQETPDELLIRTVTEDGKVLEERTNERSYGEYEGVVKVDHRIALPIQINELDMGVVYFQFERAEQIETAHVSFIKLLQEKVAFAFYKGFFMKNLLSIVTNGLAEMTEARDPETGNHLKRMSRYSQIIARHLLRAGKFPDVIDNEFVENILICAPMHDIGKASIPDNILLKPGRLTNDEYEVMKSHAEKGYEVLHHMDQDFRRFGISYFSMAAQIALGHQEKYDGTGYPHGRSGNEIPLEARICALADVFDALTSKRPYKPAFSLEKSYQIIRDSAGTHFDPDIYEAFMNGKDQIEAVYDRYKEV